MGELKLKNLDSPVHTEDSLDQSKLSLISNHLQIKKPNRMQSWLIDVIASALSFVIVYCCLAIVGIFLKNPDSQKKN